MTIQKFHLEADQKITRLNQEITVLKKDLFDVRLVFDDDIGCWANLD